MMNKKIIGNLNDHRNPEWPPKLFSILIINHPSKKYENNIFLGFCYKYLWDIKACLILLFNNTNYVENILVDRAIVKDKEHAKGIIVLLPTHKWNYIDEKRFETAFKVNKSDMTKNMNLKKRQFESTVRLANYPITQYDLMTYSRHDENKAETKTCNEDDNHDDSLLTSRGEYDFNNLFREQHVNVLTNLQTKKFVPINDTIKKLLMSNLKLFKNPKNSKIIVNKNVAVKNLIENMDDEINEGKKIIEWLTTTMKNIVTNDITIFGSLQFSIHNGYVHIGRDGINVSDNITKDLVGKLTYFSWQYNKSIEYDTLKHLLFQTEFQKTLSHDVKQRQEVEKILLQEYLICLHPTPQYLMFVLQRLIIAWFADDLLTKTIRKIKVLINQWRAKPNEGFNAQYGILPMIVVYPKYGSNSAKKCLASIANYFSLYNNVAWKCSLPSYCIKINDLIFYTNGFLDLKLYMKRVLKEHNGNVQNDSFEEDLSKVKLSNSLDFVEKKQTPILQI